MCLLYAGVGTESHQPSLSPAIHPLSAIIHPALTSGSFPPSSGLRGEQISAFLFPICFPPLLPRPMHLALPGVLSLHLPKCSHILSCKPQTSQCNFHPVETQPPVSGAEGRVVRQLKTRGSSFCRNWQEARGIVPVC